ncbi:MAG TPA: Mur ligase family protein [Microlunatus sp.]|nr:Mur ligase family protein [Microlunatus sp.]
MAGSLVEVRLLDGPNLYFPRPAAKATFDLSALLDLPEADARRFAEGVGLTRSRPGAPGSAFRQRFVARAVAHLVRFVARSGGVSRLAVRSRPGPTTSELVVAYPWRNSGKAQALARAVALVLDGLAAGQPVDELVAEAGQLLAAAPRGERPELIRPTVPVVAITGTNGKTTTSRMIGHIARRAGTSVGWSSTDGVYVNGELVEAGDYSGPSGAGRVLSHPGIELAVTETARGGILRRGVGVASNDVSVVTNISADHLGLGGIDTLDQLAEVKAVITKITRPTGWCVLNADDPRTFAMRLGTKAQIWVFTRDPGSPNARAVIDAGGRVTTVLDGWIAVLRPGDDPLPVIEVADVPMTLAGLSRVNVENALAATSAALALGYSAQQVADGLRTFTPAENPGRMNVWTVPVPGGDASVVIDLAHNEAGLEALLEILDGIRPEGGRLLLGIGTAGDRGDDVFVRLGEMAGLGADVVAIVQKPEYLRGRTADQIAGLLADGLAHAGVHDVPEFGGEVDGCAWLVAQARAGDVVGVMAHEQRDEIDAWLIGHGGSRDDAATLRAKARAARSW